jgi:RNA polymerase sigma-70 factor (ECF subfamily)
MTDSSGPGQSRSTVVKSAQMQAVAPELDFVSVYEAELTHVWHSLRRFGVRPADLEDLCHDVFVAFFRGRERFDPARPVRPWLSGIAFRVASEYRRRASFRCELAVEAPMAAAPGPAADDCIALRQEQDLVLAALQALSDERRTVLIMHDLDEQSMPEIAEALDWPLNTAYSRLRLARADFAAALARLGARRAP